MGGRSVGYEYGYRFWVEDELIPFYLNRSPPYGYSGEFRNFVFEIRTNFIMKKRERKRRGDADVIIDSETLCARVREDGKEETMLYCYALGRLTEYWMSVDEINRFAEAACAFARGIHHIHDHHHKGKGKGKGKKDGGGVLTPIVVVVGLDVCTVQQEGESLSAAMDRAIRAENLVPLYLYRALVVEEEEPKKKICQSMGHFLLGLPRIRVGDSNIDNFMHHVCAVCLKKPRIGAEVSMLPCCFRESHSHCLFRWLADNNRLCPSCLSPKYTSYAPVGKFLALHGDISVRICDGVLCSLFAHVTLPLIAVIGSIHSVSLAKLSAKSQEALNCRLVTEIEQHLNDLFLHLGSSIVFNGPNSDNLFARFDLLLINLD